MNYLIEKKINGNMRRIAKLTHRPYSEIGELFHKGYEIAKAKHLNPKSHKFWQYVMGIVYKLIHTRDIKKFGYQDIQKAWEEAKAEAKREGIHRGTKWYFPTVIGYQGQLLRYGKMNIPARFRKKEETTDEQEEVEQESFSSKHEDLYLIERQLEKVLKELREER